jgi:hypothetical protein
LSNEQCLLVKTASSASTIAFLMSRSQSSPAKAGKALSLIIDSEDLPTPDKSIQVVEREEIKKLRQSKNPLMLDE